MGTRIRASRASKTGRSMAEEPAHELRQLGFGVGALRQVPSQFTVSGIATVEGAALCAGDQPILEAQGAFKVR